MKALSGSRLGTAAVVIGSILGTYFFSGSRNRRSRNQVFKKQQKKLDRNLIAPANATFGLVWPIIYLGTTALAIHQALPGQRDNPRYQRAVPWFWTSYGLNALFGYFFSSGDKNSRVAAGVTTLATLPMSLGLHQALEIGKTEAPLPEIVLQKSVSLYAGWVTAASVVSTSNLLMEAGYSPTRTQQVPMAEAVLGVTALLGTTVSHRLNDPYYLMPFVAVFAGIAAKQYKQNTQVAGVASALALGTVGLIAPQMWRKRQSRPAIPLPAGPDLPEDNLSGADSALIETGATVDVPQTGEK